MITIKDAEKLSGISAELFRYYEKQNLILPKRNSVNSCRLNGSVWKDWLTYLSFFPFAGRILRLSTIVMERIS